MGVKINSSGGGSVTLDAPVTASNYTVTLPAASGTPAVLASVTNNGVVYINSSGQATSGSALTFDGYSLVQSVSNSAITSQSTTATSASQFRATTVAGTFYLGVDGSGGGSFGTANAAALWNSINSPMLFAVNNTEQMRLTSTGLGIGTSSPSAKLSVTSTASRVMQIDSTNANGFGVAFSNSGTDVAYLGSNKWNLGGNLNDISLVVPGANNLIFGTNNTERMRIDSSGNLGLGTTPAASNLATFQSPYGIHIGENQFNALANAYYNSGWKYIGTGVATQYIQVGSDHRFNGAASGTAGGAVSFEQLLAFARGTTVALQNATTQSGTGITFPAIQSASSDANTLDDYEEGTFTPTLVGGTTNPTYTNAGADGSYTKVGRFVSVNCHIQANSISGGSGAIGVGNLPFTNGVGTWAAVTMGYANFSGASLPTQSMLIYSSNKVYFWTTTTQIQLGSYTSVDVYLTINYIV